ncbi:MULTISPECIES: glutathione S-transferase N-terminal domain-containing protein [Variovorax]|uniref:glutathione S-transferase N-terminal domain-containing protein n=1 Tax=Variovorax TaxID=34072 RepID=UPI002859F85B|nr:glutathione S-transferase N-terminal domain-containing protein [Variovorax sp. 3319]MDR6890673.1 glutathione S-transferase [Variovorax sp. 3319]
MKLIYSRLSPYARKVLVLAHELGIVEQLELVAATVTPTTHDAVANLHNPFGKVPTLLLEDGQVLLDSRVICDYLLDVYGSPALSPSGAELWAMRTRAAVAEGLMDAAMVVRYEIGLRPEAVQWKEWVAAYEKKITQALDFLERSAANVATPMPSLADIGMACALGYLDFRFAHLNWRHGRPQLTAHHEALAGRPSLIATRPS